MNNNNANIFWWVLGLVIVLLIIWGIWSYATPAAGTTTAKSAAAAQVVTSFGAELQQVSLLAPNASSTIAAAYAPYVDPSLLATWEANPSLAPGRQTSSPWPDHITVASTVENGSAYMVTGTIALMTSTGSAGETPFTATVAPENGGWYITAFSTGSTTGN